MTSAAESPEDLAVTGGGIVAVSTPDSEFEELPGFPEAPPSTGSSGTRPTIPPRSYMDVVHGSEKVKFNSSSRKGK